MARCARLSLVVLLVASFALPANGDPARLRQARAALRGQLHELADWCRARKLFGSRYDVYELVLELWPQDETARKRNGYARAADGAWLPRKKRPANLSRDALPALREWQTRLADEYVEAVVDATRGLEDGARNAHHGAAIALALRVAPEHEALREQNGEVRGKQPGGRAGWILVETQRSRIRRTALRKAAKAAVTALPAPETGEVVHDEEHTTVRWKHVLRGPRARMLGTTPRRELVAALQYGQASFALFEAAFGEPPKPIPGLTFYTFPNSDRGNLYIDAQPHVTPAFMAFATNLATLWLPESERVIIKSPTPEVRVEAAPRQAISGHLRNAFGITARQGWAVEGFGLHLTQHLTGTRLIYSVRQSKYRQKKDPLPDLANRLRQSGTDWLAEGRALLASSAAPNLHLVLGKTVNTLTPEDLLYGYVLAVFLLEGRVHEVPGFLRALTAAKTADYDAVVGAHLGMDVTTLGARVRRWLDETRNVK